VDIPLKVKVSKQLQSISGFKLVRFQDKFLYNPDLHWYVLIRVPQEPCFLVVIITSEIDKRIAYYRNTKKQKAVQCLIKIDNNIFPFLTKPCVIECNKTEYLKIEEIIHKIDEEKGFTFRNESVPTYLRQEIVSAIIYSPLISRFIGNKARSANPV